MHAIGNSLTSYKLFPTFCLLSCAHMIANIISNITRHAKATPSVHVYSLLTFIRNGSVSLVMMRLEPSARITSPTPVSCSHNTKKHELFRVQQLHQKHHPVSWRKLRIQSTGEGADLLLRAASHVLVTSLALGVGPSAAVGWSQTVWHVLIAHPRLTEWHLARLLRPSIWVYIR